MNEQDLVVSPIKVKDIADILDSTKLYIIPSMDVPPNGSVLYVSFKTYHEICKKASSVKPKETTPSDG